MESQYNAAARAHAAELLRQVGWELADVDLIELNDHDVSARYIAELRAAGLQELDVDELIRLSDHGVSAKYMAELRQAGLNVMVYPEPAKLQKQFKFADKMKMKVALVIGPDEAEKGLVVVKNLSKGEQVQVKREAVLESVKGILKNA